MDRVKCSPAPIAVGYWQLSGYDATFRCKGKAIIDSCYFAGAQDDPVNVHGTNLRAL